MPLIVQKNIAQESILVLWHIEEPADWFQNQLQLNSAELAVIESLKKPGRKIHWLSSRFLIRMLLKTDRFIELKEDEYGRPVISNFNIHISISHSGDYSALLMSDQHVCGLDIEIINEKAERVSKKFLREIELQKIGSQQRLWQITACWCCKEAMFKWFGKKQIDFRKNLLLNEIPQHSSGKITGTVQKEDFRNTLEINYETIGQLLMAYTLN